MISQYRCLLAAAALAGTGLLAPVAAQSPGYQPVQGPHTLNPGEWPAHYPFADETEAAVAAPEVHHVRYIDSHVRLVEVAYFPGVVGNMHGHPFPSVFAVDAPVPKSTNTMFDPAHNMKAVVTPPPDGLAYPFCRAASPQNPHHESNLDSYPHHFLRLEFLPGDGADLRKRWPGSGTRQLFEDDHIRLIEVLIRPGEVRRAPASPYPAVLAFDSATPLPQTRGSHASAPLPGFEHLGCAATAPTGPEVTHNTGKAPIHYYRIEFKRIDGDGLKTHWREWYPWMAQLKDAYDRSPNKPNF
ncbi:hypothetical protein [Novosphingobium terrae]|uniref:hypothetical protein n=1 Tax=Novosphingobium terrae TaxID=2726189 RepID=UPI00197FAA7F|nr:hypothetical protein [Novosphingobium terrae]